MLSPVEIDRITSVFQIYDFKNENAIDAANLGEALRALDLTPSLKTIEELGGNKEKGTATISLPEFMKLFETAKQLNEGCLQDYIELFKCYDKHNDGRVDFGLIGFGVLGRRGEKLSDAELQLVLDECGGGDEPGDLRYLPMLQKITDGPASSFDNVDIKPEKVKQIPSVSFTAAKPMYEEEPEAEATFTLKAPRKSIAQ